MDIVVFLVMAALLECNFCHPTPEDIKIPSLVSSPEEINNLYHDPDNVNEHRDVAPLSGFNPEVELEATVREVEDLIKSNSKLPRLTRGEIIDILENITKTDTRKVKTSNTTRANGQRAIMVVMPFTAGSAQGDIKELYTRPPVTHMIGEDVPKLESRPRKKPARRKPPSFPIINVVEDQSNLIDQTNKDSLTNVHVLSTTTVAIPTSTKKNRDKIRTITTSEASKIQITTTETYDFENLVTTFAAPQEDSQPQRKFQELPQRFYNHRYPGDELTTIIPENGLRIISPPVLVNYDDGYSLPYTIKLQDLPNKPTIASEVAYTTHKTIIDDISIPEDLKIAIKNLEILNNQQFNEMQTENLEKSSTKPSDPILNPTTTTTIKPMPDISEVADNLSPDMRDLLMNFGLIQDPSKALPIPPEENNFDVQDVEIKPASYQSFKRLPDDTPARGDMDDFLARFGLGRNSARSQKSLLMNKPEEVETNTQLNLNIVAEPLKFSLPDLGFTTTNVKSVESYNHFNEASKNVFNPTAQNSTEEELGRLSRLINMIKDLDQTNSNLTDEDLKGIDVETLQELIKSFNGGKFVALSEQEAPNPLNYDYNVVKSEVKREENITTTSTTAATLTTSEEIRNPSFEELEASFGGLAQSSDVTTEIVTTPRPSGFYYLIDWNTLLEVDDQNGKRVNLRFQPTIGDPKNFRYVTVP